MAIHLKRASRGRTELLWACHS